MASRRPIGSGVGTPTIAGPGERLARVLLMAAGRQRRGLRVRVLLDAAALGHRLGLHERGAVFAGLVLDLEDAAVGGLDLRGEAELDLQDLGEAFLLDRDRVQVVLAAWVA
jgi:hypothetical protein